MDSTNGTPLLHGGAMKRIRILYCAAAVCIIGILAAVWLTKDFRNQVTGRSQAGAGTRDDTRTPSAPRQADDPGSTSNPSADTTPEIPAHERQQEKEFLATLKAARDLRAQMPQRDWGRIQSAIEPFNDRLRKFSGAVKRAEENLTSEDLAFQESHPDQIASFKSKQEALLLPQHLVTFSQSEDNVGQLTMSDVFSTLMTNPDSHERIMHRFDEYKDVYGEGELIHSGGDLIERLKQLAPELSARYSVMAKDIPPNLRSLYQAENEFQANEFMSTVYYEYLTANVQPWEAKLLGLQDKLLESLSRLPATSETKSRLASELSEFLQETSN